MSTIIRNASGAIIRRSRNLRGLLDHARRTFPRSAILEESPGGSSRYLLTVHFWNGDVAASEWADWRVCADWLLSRRSWGALPVHGMREFRARYNHNARR